MIERITRMYVRRYSDSGQITTYVEWIDTRGRTGRTEGSEHGAHMAVLIKRGAREAVRLEHEVW